MVMPFSFLLDLRAVVVHVQCFILSRYLVHCVARGLVDVCMHQVDIATGVLRVERAALVDPQVRHGRRRDVIDHRQVEILHGRIVRGERHQVAHVDADILDRESQDGTDDGLVEAARHALFGLHGLVEVDAQAHLAGIDHLAAGQGDSGKQDGNQQELLFFHSYLVELKEASFYCLLDR
jgi:hypothetical protein